MEYKDVKSYEGLYLVSDTGIIKSLPRNTTKGKIMKLGLRMDYVTLRLSKNNNTKNHNVHRLVAEAFIPNPENKPQVNHKDGNRQNNIVSNLEWNTAKENTQHAYKVLNYGGSRCKFSNEQVIEIRKRLKNGERNIDLSKQFNVHYSTIKNIKSRRTYKYI